MERRCFDVKNRFLRLQTEKILTVVCVQERERESKITDVKFFLFMQRDKK